MDHALDRADFSPPTGQGWRGPLGLAVLIHGLLVLALTWGISWNRSSEPVVMSAELWSSLPQMAAPKAVETEADPEPDPVEPSPPKPVPPKPPVPQAVKEPPRGPSQAEIALQKKQEQAKREAEKRESDKREAERRQKELAKKEKEEAAKAEALKQKKLEAQRKADEAKRTAMLEAERKKNLERMMGMAGASGAAGSTGTALRDSGPSASYAGKVVARVKPNIVFTETLTSNPVAEVEVRTLPDGTIAGRKLIKSSGHTGWDNAVLRAIDRTASLPKDEKGKVPSSLILAFRPSD